jgi:plasmid stabilization system protein ParE
MALWSARDEEKRESQLVVIARNTNRVDQSITTALPTTSEDTEAHEEDVRDLTRWLSEAAESSTDELANILSVAKEVLKVLPEIGVRVWQRLTREVRGAIEASADQGTIAALSGAV